MMYSSWRHSKSGTWASIMSWLTQLYEFLEARAHANGGLVGKLDGHLEQADGELGWGLRGDPQPEGVVDLTLLRSLGHVRLDLSHVAQAEVGVLEQHPVSLPRGGGH